MKTRYFSILLGTALLAALTGCEKESMNEFIETAPKVASFTPAEGYAGCEVTITGEALNNVVAAKIGDADAEIAQRLSDTRISIRVPAMAPSGKITLLNSKGAGVSATDFTVTYPAPAPALTDLPEEVELSSNLLIFGERMSVITRVLFKAEGHDAHEAEKVSQNDREIVVRVPYVEADDAAILFEYYDGAELSIAGGDASAAVKVVRFQPKVADISATAASIGDIVTLEGEYLDKVDRVLLDGSECMVTLQTPETLKFVVPELDSFTDGENTAALEIEYFDGGERATVNSGFVVNVPRVLFWEDRKVWGQGRDVEELTSFFSPQTGICYANSLWRTLDAVSYQYQAATCSANQVPAVSEAEYESVVPYLFFTGVSAGQLQLNSPAGSASMLKNIFWENNSANDYRVTGANANCYGTPVLGFLTLDASNPAHAELIGKVAAGTLDRLDQETYPIDTEAKKCGDISISSIATNVKDTQFAPGVFTVGEEKDTDLDAYIMVFYYNHKGQNSSNRAENIRRMGVMRIKHIDFRLYNNTNAPSSSSVTFDMYWMKRDYK
ncbi:MAG: IPT/TIG domain-containing protein [Muribaculaceae bacterium]|nr:IPT/TIG domain-containing protein [Muribaculaceae bacterium]